MVEIVWPILSVKKDDTSHFHFANLFFYRFREYKGENGKVYAINVVFDSSDFATFA